MSSTLKRVEGLQNHIVGREIQTSPRPEPLSSIDFVRGALDLSFSVPRMWVTALKFNQLAFLILLQKKLVQLSEILNLVKRDHCTIK